MASYVVSDTSLTAVADAIRTKTGKSAQMAFPDGFVDEIGDIGGGGGGVSYDDIANMNVPSGEVVLTATRVENYAFAYREDAPAWTVSGPNVTYLGQNAFRADNTLTEAYFPNLASSHNTGYMFHGCSNLTVLDWGKNSRMTGNTVVNCTRLVTLILRSTSLVACANTSVFNGTPFKSGGTGGTIYIPKVLYDELGTGSANDYKAATNWSTYDGYGTITWAQIEGSAYELQGGE